MKWIVLRDFAVIGTAGMAVICLVFVGVRYRQMKTEILGHERQKAELIRTGVLSAMMATGDPVVVRYTVDSFKKHEKADFRMVRNGVVRNQFGMRKGEEPRGQMEWEVLNGIRSEFSELNGSTFRLVLPFVADKRCGRCHQGFDAAPVAPGTVMGTAELVVDVGQQFNAAYRLITQVALCMLLVVLALGASVYWMIYREVLRPIAGVAHALYGLGRGGIDGPAMAPATSREFAILNDQAGRAFKAATGAKLAHEKEMADERRKMDKVREFALDQAGALGITDAQDLDFIIKRLSRAVAEVEKSASLKQVTEFVLAENKEMAIGNDRRLIGPSALYLTGLIANHKGSPKKGAVELALEEAITNAMIHGNLGISSALKEENDNAFERAVAVAMNNPAFAARKVKIGYAYDGQSAVFRIEDEGKGFDWRKGLAKPADEDILLPHGRGLIIIRAFAAKVEFNDMGNVITLTFNLQN